LPDPAILVLTHAPDRDVAARIARALLQRRLAACVNIGAGVHSMYHWRGEIETAEEVPLSIKTRADLYSNVEAAIRELHPYELPEVVAIALHAAYEPYIDWIDAETKHE
jgi:periplasmic divalent cation tolerance protein